MWGMCRGANPVPQLPGLDHDLVRIRAVNSVQATPRGSNADSLQLLPAGNCVIFWRWPRRISGLRGGGTDQPRPWASRRPSCYICFFLLCSDLPKRLNDWPQLFKARRCDMIQPLTLLREVLNTTGKLTETLVLSAQRICQTEENAASSRAPSLPLLRYQIPRTWVIYTDRL